jgi:hypothetical protein
MFSTKKIGKKNQAGFLEIFGRKLKEGVSEQVSMPERPS